MDGVAATQKNLNGAPAARHQRLLLLDGLRGVAAFGVILDHVPSEALRLLTSGRYLAVDFFWVLSGFVLALAYDQRLKGGPAPAMSPFAFMRARLVRFYPLYLLGLLIAILPALYGSIKGWEPETASDILLVASVGLLFLPFPPVSAWTGQQLFTLNGPTWTLFFELIANFLYSVSARFLTWRVFAVLLPATALLVVLIVPHRVAGAGWAWPDIDAGLVRVIYCFFAGVFIFRVKSVIRIPPMPAWLAFATYVTIIACPMPDAWRPGYNVAATLVFMPLLVAFAAGAPVSGPAARVCVVMGMLSYGVYVVHVPVFKVLGLVAGRLPFHVPGFAMVLAVAATAGAITWLAGKYYDVPLRRWLSRRVSDGKRMAPAAKHGA